uniref:Uncharacterized protein n=1 Tax=Physcomitrium patens TaxID=3218 RepID=A0A2K1IKD5_PHYPA|nr:hypothetical protein PHYPA_028439 [Physcomitrium patens]
MECCVLLDQVEDATLGVEITHQHVKSVLRSRINMSKVCSWSLEKILFWWTLPTKSSTVVVGKSLRVHEAEIPNLLYLQAICKEVFCLHPTTPLLYPHVNQHACTVFGYDILAGTSMLVNVGAIVQDPSIWEDPLVFKPERFLERHSHLDCPGIGLSLTMVYILTATLLHCFEWSLPQDLLPEDLDMARAPGSLTVQANPLIAILKAWLSF